MIRKCIDWNYDNIPVWIWMLFITASVYEYDYVQGWLEVIGLFMFQLATNRVLGYRTWNFADVLSLL